MPVTPRSRRVKQKGDEKKEKYPFGEIVRVNERSSAFLDTYQHSKVSQDLICNLPSSWLILNFPCGPLFPIHMFESL